MMIPLGMLYKHLCIGSYIKNKSEFSDFVGTCYVDPKSVDIIFPEKRNLIFIYLESMETTFSGINNGGATKEDIIPELTSIALDNIDFSKEGEINGAYALEGATYIMGE